MSSAAELVDSDAFLNSDMPASAWIDTELARAWVSDEDYAVDLRRDLGRKFETEDLEADPRLVEIAKGWLPGQKGSGFDVLDTVARKHEMFGYLTTPQWTGALK